MATSATDRIEQRITIDADLERVWNLVTRPGWWVPDDMDRPVDRTPGHLTMRESAQYGRFPVELVRLDPRTYAAFRWASEFPGEDPTPGRATLVEFFVEPSEDAVAVTVVETGFDSLELPADRREAGRLDNVSGWGEQLGVLRSWAEQATVS